MCPIIKQNVLRHCDEPNVSVEREKSNIRIASHKPEEVRKKRKKMDEIQQNHSVKNIDKKIKVFN